MTVPQILYQGFLYGVPLAIAAALFGFRWKEGFWGNVLGAGALCFSALVAVGWWEDVAELLSKQIPAMLYLSDTVAVWAIFVLTLAILMEIVRLASRVKVKFAEPIEQGGNALALGAMFIVLYGFFLFTVDLAGVGDKNDATVASDSIQIKALRILSAGNLSSFTKPQQFDQGGNFRQRHLERRKAIWKSVTKSDGSLFYEGTIPPRR
ncbi:MAG: hypothetical protein LBN39_06040 [Planctomycetaceae bacterium]|jgi:hypothetical protein|nr:hypothetical protein [Planctomycetaceae bacterium]